MHQEPLKYTEKYSIDKEVCRVVDEITSRLISGIQPTNYREFIDTNGIGGYVSLTLLNELTRKFHGLLVASIKPPTNRWVFVSNLEEVIHLDDRDYRLSENIEIFRQHLFPEHVYRVEDITINRKIFMPYGENTTILRYEIKSDREFSLSFTPLINSRHFYDTKENLSFSIAKEGQEIRYKPNNNESVIRIIAPLSSFSQDTGWREIEYEVDRMRGDSFSDSLFAGGEFKIEGKDNMAFYIVLTVEHRDYDPVYEFEKEMRRREVLLDKRVVSHLPLHLTLASDSFIVRRNELKSIIAGYHWFGDWGRDSLISLPGLLLVTRRYEEAKEILLNLVRYENNGLIPNAFIDRSGDVIYNTVDAPLWFIDRVYQYLKYTNDMDFLMHIWEKMASIVDNYIKGTYYGIKMDDDYLLSHDAGLTWMDVKLGDNFITPRARKAVEIQALWYNTLRIMDLLTPDGEGKYREIADLTKENFLSEYDRQYDVLDTKDCSCRPNKIFLVALDFSMIDNTMGEKIIMDVEERLLTPYGLRTLDMENPLYKGKYLGEFNKDIAYHNGTVWPWLIGYFVRAFLKVKGYDEKWRSYAFENYLKTLLSNLGEGCIGSINEIFDGDEPYTPRGCISQAWSVAEILRTLAEDILYIRPPYEKHFLNNAL